MTRLRSGIAACVLIGAATWSGGCAATPPEAGETVDPEGALVRKAVRETLARPLSPEAAIEIALLENRSLRELYEELGLTQADLARSGLLGSTFRLGESGSGRGPEQDGGRPEHGVARAFLAALFRSAGRKCEGGSAERTRSDLSRRVLDTAFAVKEAYYAAAGAGEVAELRREAARAAEEAAVRAATEPDGLGVAYWTALAEQARARHARAEAELLASRDRLSRLMGLSAGGIPWTVEARLPEPPGEEAAQGRWEELALGRRLDVGTLREEGRAIRRLLGLVRADEWPAIARRDGPSPWAASPRLSRELPLLDLKPAVVLGLETRLGWNEAREASLTAEIRSDVLRRARRLELARSRIRHVREVLIPLRKRIVELTRERYSLARAGVPECVDAWQKDLDARQQGIEAVREYWVVRCDLERATDGDVPTTAQ